MSQDKLPALLLVGAGRMGGAMLAGWRSCGLSPSVVLDPFPQAGLQAREDQFCKLVADIPAGFVPRALVLAVKPQMADDILAQLAGVLPDGVVVLSIMAGRRIAGLSQALGGAAIVRAMPNTPGAIGQGITVACAGPGVGPAQLSLCERLLASMGEVAWVEDEHLIDPVTAVSGSGPAYVFLLAELLEQAAITEGIPAALAKRLARRTVSGSGALLAASDEDASSLRRGVTSPGGTTERALAVLMAEAAWPSAIRDAIRAATARAEELAK